MQSHRHNDRIGQIRDRLAAHMLAPDVHSRPDPPQWFTASLWHLASELKTLPEVIDAIESHPKLDQQRVVDQWLLWLLEDELKEYAACKPVADLYRRRLAGDEPTKKEWAAARAEAWAAARAEAWAAAAAVARAAEAKERMRAALNHALAEQSK